MTFSSCYHLLLPLIDSDSVHVGVHYDVEMVPSLLASINVLLLRIGTFHYSCLRD